MFYSIILPTMWRCNDILTMLPQINDHPLIKEIIVINNDVSRTPKEISKYDKIVMLNQEQNIFVNPAWNLGVTKSNTDHICLLSDDVIFDPIIFDFMHDKLTPHHSCAGPHYIANPVGQLAISDQIEPSLGYGTLLFFNKRNYKPIPEELKIFYGDNYIILVHTMKGMMPRSFINLKMKTIMGTTSANPSLFSAQTAKEHRVWKAMFGT